MLPTEAVAHPRVRELRREWKETAEREGSRGLRLALAGLSSILGKYERELALVKRKLREKEAQIERLQVTLLLAEDSVRVQQVSEETRSEAALREEVVPREKRSLDTSQDSGKSGKRFKENESFSTIRAEKSEGCASETKQSSIEATCSQSHLDGFKPGLQSCSEVLRPTTRKQALLTEADFVKEEWSGADLEKGTAWTCPDFRRDMENLGLLLRTQKRSLEEESEFHADLSADLLGGLTEEQLSWIGEIIGHDDPHLVEIKDIYAELRKYVGEYPSQVVQKYVGNSFSTVRSSVVDSDETSFRSSDTSDTDSMDSDSEDSAPSARFRKRRSIGNDIVELMIKRPRHGPAMVDQMSKCLLPDNEWLQLQMYDRFRRMYC